MQVPERDPKEFKYFNGAEQVYGDRLAIYRQLLIETHGQPNALISKIFVKPAAEMTPDELLESSLAADQHVAIVRKLFGLIPFDAKTGTGARDEHCWTVWNQFLDSLGMAKKKPVNSQTSSLPTDAVISDPPGTSTSA